jgi:general secretion pathway protein G
VSRAVAALLVPALKDCVREPRACRATYSACAEDAERAIVVGNAFRPRCCSWISVIPSPELVFVQTPRKPNRFSQKTGNHLTIHKLRFLEKGRRKTYQSFAQKEPLSRRPPCRLVDGSTLIGLQWVNNAFVWGKIKMKKRKGFTLVELVVVVMILGILAAVAAPKLLGTSGTATDNGLRQTLSVVRDAIERYAAENGGDYPPGGNQAAFKTAIASYLRGPFPTCPVGGNNADVAVGAVSTVGGSEGWRYNTATGEFLVNSSTTDNSDTPVAYSTY